ncbi:amino acid adenylation domain-containing protein [Butyricimonas hominis]|uniref:Amino acid adenylation domain-containing protein n=1 Tax=Butyricimonas hominis TaxID=2763032 RepID=A0ABR7D007_9BACT|nr:amino acid adenylation domain-containing protein [Butyricimonas hominis]MBC5621264.1 amino acid adenylation domain-containing protein [Butyricimonas hominis]
MDGMNILKDIVRSAGMYPGKTAFVIDGIAYSYKELFACVNGIHAFLDGREEEVIGVVAENRIETYAAILAVLLSGKTYVILHPHYPDNRNNKIREAGDIGVVLYADECDMAKAMPESMAFVSTRELRGEEHAEYNYGSGDTKAYIIFTSGSTGEPKGVPITRDNLNAFYTAYSALGWNLGADDRMLQMFELTFDVSVVSTLFPLTVGAAIYTVGPGEMKYTKVYELLEDERLTFAAIAPSLLQFLSPYFDEIRLPDLKYLIVTAEAAQADVLARFRACAPNAEFVNLYGPTEATIYCTAYRIPREECKHYHGMIAIGRPFEEMEVVIADEDGQALNTGEKGELWVSGPQVMAGYWKDREKSEQVLVRHNGRVFYKTGDLCYMDADGDIIYCGRKDYQVKVQGFRVELNEIEYTARKFYREEKNVVVVAKKDDDGGCRLHLFIEAAECDTPSLLEFMKMHLPVYMLPARVHCLEVFPLGTSNKIDRKKLLSLV